MLRWITLIAAVVFLSALGAYYTQSASNSTKGPLMVGVNNGTGPQPKVEIAEALLYDFGVLPQETKHVHTWEVKNVGQGDLEMSMKSSTCSCTIAKLATKEGEPKKTVIVKPNDTTTIDLEWETRRPENPEYAKSATIATNDPTKPTFTLSIKGKVYPPLIVYPPEMITLSNISNEETTKATVAVFSMDRPQTKVVKVRISRAELMDVTHVALSAEERKAFKITSGGERVDVAIKPGLPLGKFHDELIIETDHPNQEQVKISLTGNAVGPISVIPERVRWTDVRGRDGGTHNMKLLVKGNKEVAFTVADKPEKIEVKITPTDPVKQKGSYLMQVIVPPGTAPGSVEGEIVLTTDHPRAKELRIPVMVLISGVSG
jgi:Protein of unknown function (DUF1573)